jgi:uncharacterized membrane protein
MDILYTLAWWAGMLYVGAIAFIFLRRYMTALSDHGYAVAKAVGLIGFSYILWLLSSLHILPFDPWSTWLVAALLGIGAGIYLYRNRDWLQEVPWRNVVATEAIFAASLFIWSIVRSYNPKIEGVEKLMDIALLQGLLRSDYLPPIDPWYAGEVVNYYYFGHFQIASLAQLTQVPGQIAFNLGLPLVFALCIILITSLVFSLTKSKLAAGISAFLVTLSCNLDPAINALKGATDYIFFSATRLDPYTINEFPLYSFTVADLHAHTLGLPAAIGVICLLYILLKTDKNPWPIIGVLALLLGSAGPTNSFDLIIYGGMTGMIMLLRAYLMHGWETKALYQAVLFTLGIGLLSAALYAPFYLNFHAPVGGVGVDLFQTPLWFILVNFGVMLFMALPLIANRISRLQTKGHSTEQPDHDEWFAWVALTLALLLILATEFVYLKDIYTYQNPPYDRANTIFKVYYQVWVLLAIVAGYGLAMARRIKLRWRLVDGYVVGVGALLAMSLVGTWSGIEAYKDNKSPDEPTWTLDGFAYLSAWAPDQLRMIDWMNDNIEGQPNILEAAGESYTQKSRVSAYTGLPTILGWASHEWGWRYTPTAWGDDIAPRMGLVQQIYQASTAEEMKRLLEENDIKYMVASPVELEQYGIANFGILEQVAGKPVFKQGGHAVYQIPFQ